MRYRTLLPLALALSFSAPVLAEGGAPARLGIGRTGILCVKEPCPWRGIIDLDVPARSRMRPLWSGKELPPLDAGPEDAARLEAAWEDGTCLAVDGTFDGRRLRVARILGPCP